MSYHLEDNIEYRNYIKECCLSLKKGNFVFVYYEYQLEKLKELYGKELKIEYDEKNNWWRCKLLKICKDKNNQKKKTKNNV